IGRVGPGADRAKIAEFPWWQPQVAQDLPEARDGIGLPKPTSVGCTWLSVLMPLLNVDPRIPLPALFSGPSPSGVVPFSVRVGFVTPMLVDLAPQSLAITSSQAGLNKSNETLGGG